MIALRRFGGFRQFVLSAADGEAGHVEEVYFDERNWIVRYLVIRINGAPASTVLLSPGLITEMDEETASLRTGLTREQVAHCPVPADLPTVSSRRQQRADARLSGGLLSAGPGPGNASAAGARATAASSGAEAQSPRLRSSEEVTGYMMVARDGVVGLVLDLVVELPGWNVRYLEVEWRGWNPAERVLVEPTWVTGIDWLHREVSTDLDRERIRIAAASARSAAVDQNPPVAASNPATTSSNSAVIAS